MTKKRKFGQKTQNNRVINNEEQFKRFLIICEGEQTEPNYFSDFPVTHKIIIRGKNHAPAQLLKDALSLKQKYGYTEERDEVWLLFDKDDLTATHYNETINGAKKQGIRVAYSNEAFELWFLLHFDYCDTAIHRQDYCDKLQERLKEPYRKNDTAMYKKLKDRQATALKNAIKLLESYGDTHNPAQDNPSTTVHLLVETLNREIMP